MNKLPVKRRILIVGEGRETEYNYFVGFRNTFEKELEATATSIRVARGKGGNARGIVETAVSEKKKFNPVKRFGDRVFLLLDTEGAGREPELPEAERIARDNEIEIVYSCPAFEYWLLCHFVKISRGHFKDCDAVIDALNKKWKDVCITKYEKADEGVFARLSHLLNAARTQALQIDLYHLTSRSSARRVNPSAQVYELIALLIGVQTGEKCPIDGNWGLVGNATITVRLKKGDVTPSHDNTPAHWRL